METPKNFGIRVAVKVLGGVHFVGQTVADLALNGEVALLKPATTDEALAIIDYRNKRSYELAVKCGLFKNPASAIADMDNTQ